MKMDTFQWKTQVTKVFVRYMLFFMDSDLDSGPQLSKFLKETEHLGFFHTKIHLEKKDPPGNQICPSLYFHQKKIIHLEKNPFLFSPPHPTKNFWNHHLAKLTWLAGISPFSIGNTSKPEIAGVPFPFPRWHLRVRASKVNFFVASLRDGVDSFPVGRWVWPKWGFRGFRSCFWFFKKPYQKKKLEWVEEWKNLQENTNKIKSKGYRGFTVWWWFRNPAETPVVIGSWISHNLRRVFLHPNGGFLVGFLNHQQYFGSMFPPVIKSLLNQTQIQADFFMKTPKRKPKGWSSMLFEGQFPSSIFLLGTRWPQAYLVLLLHRLRKDTPLKLLIAKSSWKYESSQYLFTTPCSPMFFSKIFLETNSHTRIARFVRRQADVWKGFSYVELWTFHKQAKHVQAIPLLPFRARLCWVLLIVRKFHHSSIPFYSKLSVKRNYDPMSYC